MLPDARVIGADDLVDGWRSREQRRPRRRARSALPARRSAAAAIAGRMHRSSAAGAAPPTTSCSTPPRAKTDDEIANAREATRIAELGYRALLEIARPGMSEDELAVELRWHTQVARRRGQFPAALRRAAQSRGRAVERPHACSRATSSWPRSRRAIAASSRRSAAPSRSAPRHAIAQGRNTRWWCARWTTASRAAVPGAPMVGGLPRHQRGAGGGRLWRILPSAAHPPARPRARLRLDPAGRRRARQRHGARARHGVHDPSRTSTCRRPAICCAASRC